MEKIKDPYPRVGVGVVIRNSKGDYLLGHRQPASSHGAGEWCFPGGKLGFGERFEDCAIREGGEETGLKLSNPRFAGLTNDIKKAKEYGYHYITVFIEVDAKGEPKVMEPEKMAEWKWFSRNNLPKPLFEATRNFFERCYR